MMTSNNRRNILEECSRLDSQGGYSEAIRLLCDAIVSEPDEAKYWVCKGRILCDRLGRVVEAIENFEKASTLDTSSATPHQHLSLCYLLLNDLNSAERHAVRAVDLASDDAISQACLARCRLHAERFHSAVKHFELALKLDEDAAMNWSGLGEACRGAGLLDKAEHAYERAISLSPAPHSYIQLAAIKLDVNKPVHAIQALRNAQQLELSEVERTLVEGYLEIARNNESKGPK